jgi:hypothetical protein
MLLALLGLASLLRRQRALGVLLTALAANTQAAEPCAATDAVQYQASCWYGSFGLGSTRLEPDEADSGWSVTDKSDDGFKLAIGYRLTQHWFAELAYYDLGEAVLEANNPAITGDETIRYKATALWGGYQLPLVRDELALFVKLGIASLDTRVSGTRLQMDEVENSQIALGGGLQWRVNPDWFLRAELDSIDKDAYYLGFSVSRYWGF